MSQQPPCLVAPDLWQRITYHRRLAGIVAVLSQRPLPRLTLVDAARLAGMEATAFARYFRQHVGVTFLKLMHAYRVGCAIETMNREDVGIKELAALSGYRTLRSFERAFLRETGYSPSEFRHQLLATGVR